GKVAVILSVSQNRIIRGNKVTLTAKANAVDGGAPVSGQVIFYDLTASGTKLIDPENGPDRYGSALGTSALDENGEASLDVLLGEFNYYFTSKHTIVAVYVGFANPIVEMWHTDSFPDDHVASGYQSAVSAQQSVTTVVASKLTVRSWGPGTPEHPPLLSATMSLAGP